jgi:hypothetical protein
MAELLISDDQIKLKMSLWEQLGSFHGPVRGKISEIAEIKSVPDPWDRKNIMKGMRAPGTGIPGIIMLGTLRNFRGWKAFCAIYRHKPAVIITWRSGEFTDWIFTANIDQLRKELPAHLF